MDINDNISPKGGYYYNNELYYSQAYRSLSKAARDLLHCLLNELRWAKNKKKKKREVILNLVLRMLVHRSEQCRVRLPPLLE